MNNPFSKIFGNITKIGSGGGMSGGDDNTAIGIDIGTSSIKVVEIKKKGGRAMLETYGAVALGPYADLDAGAVTNLPVLKIAEALKEVLKQSGVTSRSGGFAIPVQSSLIFTLELPSTIGEKELDSIVPTEARKYIPVPITEVSLDYYILPKKEPSFEEMNSGANKEDSGKIEVLVVATQNETTSKYRSIVSECSLYASFFEIEVFSSIRANFEHELSPVLLIDFGASRTKLSIVEFGTVKAYHTVERGGADITSSIATSLGINFRDAEKMKKEFGLYDNPGEKTMTDIIKVHTDYIFSETNNVLLGYEKKYQRTINKVILSGGGSLLRGLEDVAKTNFRADIQMGHPFGKVGAPAFLDKVLETMGPEFAVSIGLALRKLQ